MYRLLAVLLLSFAASAMGDEPKTHIHFRDKAQVDSRVVLLSDVADVDSDDARFAERLLKTELITAPAGGQVRSLRQRELIDHIQLNGFDLQKLEFSGASITQVSVGASASSKLATPSSGRLSAAQRRVKQAVITYLRATHPEARRAIMDVTCDEACSTAASATAASISVVTSEPAGPSAYDVVVAIGSRGVVEEYTVKATVAESNRVVVAAKPLRVGAILTAADLKLAAPRSETEMAMAVSEVDDLVGRELTRAVGLDQIVPIDQVVQPRLVRKGDLVEVTAKSGGVRVTTQAIAQEDGALGQSIALEAVDGKPKVGQKNKETIRAQVVASGQAQIEVAGRPVISSRVGAEPARLRPVPGRLTRR